MADTVDPQNESFATLNMKPSGGGIEEINALWGRNMAANVGYLFARPFMIFNAHMGYKMDTYDASAVFHTQNGTDVHIETAYREQVHFSYRHDDWLHEYAGTIEFGCRIAVTGAGNFNWKVTFNGTDCGSVVSNESALTMQTIDLPLPSEDAGIKRVVFEMKNSDAAGTVLSNDYFAMIRKW